MTQHLAIFIDPNGHRCIVRPAHSHDGHGESKNHCVECGVKAVTKNCSFWIVDAEPFDEAWQLVNYDLEAHPNFDDLVSGASSGVGELEVIEEPIQE